VQISAGLLMYRRRRGVLEVLLAHPGGPFFRNKDDGAWTIPKGEPAAGEELSLAARREFGEEIGAPVGELLLPLGEIKQKGGKVVHAWGFEGDLPEGFVLRCNTFELEWPPRSGRRHRFPEVDRAELFPVAVARTKINPAQRTFLERLVDALGAPQTG
jgi:predicted NUDIX family NTP pyrophosphohydrolase